MANKSAKNQLRKNKKHMKVLRLCLLGFNSWYLLFSYLRGLKFGFGSILMYIIIAALQVIPFMLLKNAAKPIYEDGNLISGGKDLNAGFINVYAHDILYLMWILLALSAISPKFFWFLLIVPGYVLKKAWTLFLKNYLFPPSPEDTVEETQKKKKQKVRYVR
ncbi:hypothetical protein PCE1_003314 [Barthelona sp. PCE]